jgi:hypothetical protein
MDNGYSFILRFDDICPTMNWRAWLQVEESLREAEVGALLAIVPDNRDPKLEIASTATNFGLHGYQHVYVTKKRGLVGRRALSEFAGLGVEEQRRKLTGGFQIFKREGVRPTVWVAPGHTFDKITVSILPEVNIHIISDGFFRFPHRDGKGVYWIPQQLWSLRPVPSGVWTVCYHVNEWGQAELQQFREGLLRWKERVSSVEDIHQQFGQMPRGSLIGGIQWGPLTYWLMRIRLELQTSLRTK